MIKEQKLLQAVHDAVPAFIAYVDVEQHYRFNNRRYAQLSGRSPARVNGLHVRDVIGRTAYEQARSNIAAALNGRVVEFEMPFGADARGQDRFVHASYVPDVGEDGSVRGFVALIMDISERKRAELAQKKAEEALRESEARFRQILEAAPDAMVMVDRAGRITMVNAQASAMFGYSREELTGRPIELLVPDGFRRTHSRLRERYFARPRARAMGAGLDLSARRKDGTEVAVDVSLSPVETTDGLMVIAGIRDVTERRHAEQALLKSTAAYRDLAMYAPYGIYRSSRPGKLLSANPALAQMLGYESVDELLAIDDMSRDLYVDPHERETLIARYETGDTIGDVETEWKRKGGSRISVRLKGRNVRDERGELEGFEVFVEDITERRRLEAQLRQAQKMEAVGRLAGGVAHDFNNILTAILGVTDLGLLDLGPDHPHRADLMEIRDAASRAAGLTRQLLAFSRQQVLIPQRLNLSALVTNTERLLRRVIGEDIQVTTALDRALGTVEADPGQLEQVLLNLAVNARDAMPNGGTLSISTLNAELDATYGEQHFPVKPGPYVMLAVTDTGVGMDRDTQARLFEPFFTTKEFGKGTGLGLATVYGIVKQSGGYIWVNSEPGQGTTFTIHLPRIDGEARPERSAPEEAVRGGTETILLVEDEDALRRVTQRVLERYGYTVLAAADGQEALDLFRQHEARIGLILTDLVMPRMGGQRLCEILRREGKTVEFLFMSGYAEADREGRRTLEPEFPFLQKPWTIEDLVRKVAAVLASGGDASP